MSGHLWTFSGRHSDGGLIVQVCAVVLTESTAYLGPLSWQVLIFAFNLTFKLCHTLSGYRYLAKMSLSRTCSHAVVGTRCSRAVEDIHYIAWIIPMVSYNIPLGCSIVVLEMISGTFQYSIRRIVIRSRKDDLKQRGFCVELSDRSVLRLPSTYYVIMIIKNF